MVMVVTPFHHSQQSTPARVHTDHKALAYGSICIMKCNVCGSSDIDYTESSTHCRACGIVLEESQIVSDVTFAENSAGGAVVQGSYVSNEQRE
jgi:uncharacterized OB-fold protein